MNWALISLLIDLAQQVTLIIGKASTRGKVKWEENSIQSLLRRLRSLTADVLATRGPRGEPSRLNSLAAVEDRSAEE